MKLYAFLKNLPVNELRITFPTKLTIFRILSIPFIVYSIFSHNWNLAFFLIVFSSLSDLLDGYLARKWNEQTLLGAILDPIADKLFILSTYYALIDHPPAYFIPVSLFFLVLFKEILLVFGAFIVFVLKGNLDIKPTILGKITMDAHSLFIIWIFLSYFLNLENINLYIIFLSIIFVLVLSSFVHYVTIGFKQFYFQNNIQK